MGEDARLFAGAIGKEPAPFPLVGETVAMEDLLTVGEAVAVGVGHVGAGLVARFVGITEAVVIQVFGADRGLGHTTGLWILRFPT